MTDSVTELSEKTAKDIESANNKNKALSEQVNKDIRVLRDEAKTFKESLFSTSEKLENTSNLLDNQIPVIQETAFYTDHLKSIDHIEDIDPMWGDINTFKDNFNNVYNSLQNIETKIQNNKVEEDKKISEVMLMSDINIGLLMKKIKYAYWVAGGAAGLAIIELILLLF